MQLLDIDLSTKEGKLLLTAIIALGTSKEIQVNGMHIVGFMQTPDFLLTALQGQYERTLAKDHGDLGFKEINGKSHG